MNAITEGESAVVGAETQKSTIERKFDEEMTAARAKATKADEDMAGSICSGAEPVSLANITPAVAAIIFKDRNGKNRSFSVPKAREYQAAMQRGEWRETHQGYAFDNEGNLVDGQHRVGAQALSGVALKVVVFRKADRAIIDSIDLSKPRKAHEALDIAGIKHAAIKERIARAAIEYMGKIDANPMKPTVIQLERYVLQHDSALTEAVERGHHSVHNIAEPSISETEASIQAFIMHLGDWPSHLIVAFITTLQAGVETKDNGVIVPAARILAAARRKERKNDSLSRDQQIATMLRAARHWAKGESVAKFRAAKKTQLEDYRIGDLDVVLNAA